MRKTAVILLVCVVAGLSQLYVKGAQSRPALASPRAAGCGTVTCTTYLPIILKPEPTIPAQLEVTQGVQQPDNSVLLVANRPTYVRWTLTSGTAYTGVSALLYGERDGLPLPGSPISALNNPRTLQATSNRAVLNDTFNFKLPDAWLSGDVSLSAEASNSTGFQTKTAALISHFDNSVAMRVTIVPIEYHCNSGSTGVTTPAGPYGYLTDYTFRIYPVPSIINTTHAAVRYDGPCDSSGVPQPSSGAEWGNMLNTLSQVRNSDSSAVGYYYGLVHIDCSGSCISGIGWVDWPAAVGFDGIGSFHSSASETHAHEVGHNHGRNHAPGCGASEVDPAFPYNFDGKGIIGDSTHQNYGFDIDSTEIYLYSSYYDIMGYCAPDWVSDYTYQALWKFDNTPGTVSPAQIPGNRALLISGSIDPSTDRVTFDPVYVVDTIRSARLPDPGDYALDILDSAGRVLATYSFTPGYALPDSTSHAVVEHDVIGFHLTLPAIDGIATIRVWHQGLIAGSMTAARFAPTLRAPLRPDQLGASGQISWSGVDAGGNPVYYLVRASADNGQTWQTIGVNLTTPQITLSSDDFGGQVVQVLILASNGLRTSSLILGPYSVPEK